jgi:aspartate racemase
MHIGLIGGIGPAATEFYYRGLVAAHEATGATLDLTIVHADVRDLVRNATAGNAAAQAEIYRELTERLKGAGADAVAVTSLGGHFCISEFEAISPLPVINAIPVIDTYLGATGYKRIGLIGTRFVMQSGIYGGVSSVDFVAPQGNDMDAVHAAYLGIAMPVIPNEDDSAYLFEAGRKLVEDQGAEAVFLGGTDLFLAFDGRDCGYPVIDAAEVHIAALARASMENV